MTPISTLRSLSGTVQLIFVQLEPQLGHFAPEAVSVRSVFMSSRRPKDEDDP